MHHLELLTIFGMLTIVPGEPKCLARMNIWEAAHDRDELPPVRGFQPGYGVTRVLSMVGDSFHDALEMFQRRLGGARLAIVRFIPW